MTDRTIRNLAHLRRSASTARVLNLLKVAGDHAHTADWAERPLFRTPALNRALIIKHRLRRDEYDAFYVRRHAATKVVVPLDARELKTGGRYVFVDQRGFEATMQDAFGLTPHHPDMATLRLMDGLPSLDPFLLREQLRRGGMDPAPCYFSISEADLDRMVQFVEAEVRPLVTLSVGEDIDAVGSTRRLAHKILSNDPGDRMEALRVTLRLHPEEYQEGVFCWRGFLYYKWVLSGLMAEVGPITEALWAVRPAGRTDAAARAWLAEARGRLSDRIVQTCDQAHRTLRVYDDAYAALTRDAEPGAFRDFLLRAPGLFTRLGDQLGAIQHIVSFWRFRFGPGSSPAQAEELTDIFADFETGLAERRTSDDRALLAA